MATAITYTALPSGRTGETRLQSVLLIELFCSKFTSNHNVTKLGSTRESSLCHRKEKEKKSPREELSKHLFSKSVGLLSFYPQKSRTRDTRFPLLQLFLGCNKIGKHAWIISLRSLSHEGEGKKSPRGELSIHLFSMSVGLLSFYLQKSSPCVTW